MELVLCICRFYLLTIFVSSHIILLFFVHLSLYLQIQHICTQIVHLFKQIWDVQYLSPRSMLDVNVFKFVTGVDSVDSGVRPGIVIVWMK